MVKYGYQIQNRATKEKREPMGNGIKILIANENAEMRKNCREALSRAGYTVIEEATNGADAL